MMGMGIVGFGSLELVGLAFFFVGMPGVGSGILARFYYVQYGGTGHKFCRFHKRGLLPSLPV